MAELENAGQNEAGGAARAIAAQHPSRVADQGARGRWLAARDYGKLPQWGRPQGWRVRHDHLLPDATPPHLDFALRQLKGMFRRRAERKGANTLEVMAWLQRFAKGGELSLPRFIACVRELERHVGPSFEASTESGACDSASVMSSARSSSRASTARTGSWISSVSSVSSARSARAAPRPRSSSGFLRRSTGRLAYTPRTQRERDDADGGAGSGISAGGGVDGVDAAPPAAAHGGSNGGGGGGGGGGSGARRAHALSRQELAELFHHLDTDDSGHVSSHELQLAVTGKLCTARKKVVRAAFNALDLDGDATIEQRELRSVLSKSAKTHPTVLAGQMTRQQFVRREMERLQAQLAAFKGEDAGEEAAAAAGSGSVRGSAAGSGASGATTGAGRAGGGGGAADIDFDTWEAYFREVSAACRHDGAFERVVGDAFDPSCPGAARRAREVSELRAKAKARQRAHAQAKQSGAHGHQAAHAELGNLRCLSAGSAGSAAGASARSAASGTSRTSGGFSARSSQFDSARTGSVGSARSSWSRGSSRSHSQHPPAGGGPPRGAGGGDTERSYSWPNAQPRRRLQSRGQLGSMEKRDFFDLRRLLQYMQPDERWAMATVGAEHNIVEALWILAECYRDGHGVEQDILRSVMLVRDYGHYGLEQDHEKAAKLYHAAAAQGDADAHFGIGVCYEYGFGVEQDEQRAMEHYVVAAKQHNAPTLFRLGQIYINGECGQEKNEQKGGLLWQQAGVPDWLQQYLIATEYSYPLNNSEISACTGGSLGS
eukprot:g2373.t1